MTDIEGQINIAIHPGRKSVDRVEVASSRPVLASKVFVGKQPAQVLELVPLMFNICGNAQARTAVAAIQDALGRPADPATEAARDMLVLVENVREHLFRVFIDWPRLFQADADPQALHPLGSLLSRFRAALFGKASPFALQAQLEVDIKTARALVEHVEELLASHVFLQPTRDWLDMSGIDAMVTWTHQHDSIAPFCLRSICDHGWSSQGHSYLPPLPELDSDELCARLDEADADDFIARPLWRGELCETTPLARQLEHPLVNELTDEFGHSLLPRWMARLVEMARIPGQLRALLDIVERQPDDATSPAGKGLAHSEAARGRLIHRVRIEDNLVSGYQIVAPTEWNFHPRGLVSQSLANLSCRDTGQLDQLARLMINSIDPCVGFELEIHPRGDGDA